MLPTMARLVLVGVLTVALAGCGAATNASNGRLRVVAAENFWAASPHSSVATAFR
jgi:hypothetical protein